MVGAKGDVSGLDGMKKDPCGYKNTGSDSTCSCPFPHGFGPCTKRLHVHCDFDTVLSSPQTVRETQLGV
ncbi:hypothetical protein PIB30_050442, partial [Stylosanthes scabra]|nr:hypothetical protein [Stylosanthes scabra]